MIHDIIQFKVGLNIDIASYLILHKFDTLDAIFQAALEIESELREKSGSKFKVQSPSGWHHEKNDLSKVEQPKTKSARAENKAQQRYPPGNEGKPHSFPNSKGFQFFKCQGWG